MQILLFPTIFIIICSNGEPPYTVRENRFYKAKNKSCPSVVLWLFVQSTVGVALRPPPEADKGSKVLPEIMSKRKHIYMQRIATIFQTGELGPLLQIKLDFAIFICFVIIIMYVLLPAGERGFPLQNSSHFATFIKLHLPNILWYYFAGLWNSSLTKTRRHITVIVFGYVPFVVYIYPYTNVAKLLWYRYNCLLYTSPSPRD